MDDVGIAFLVNLAAGLTLLAFQWLMARQRNKKSPTRGEAF